LGPISPGFSFFSAECSVWIDKVAFYPEFWGSYLTLKNISEEKQGTTADYSLLCGRQGSCAAARYGSHLVNIDFVKSYLKEDGGALLLKDHTKIPISRQNRDLVREALNRGV
jgi:hypothetical protein